MVRTDGLTIADRTVGCGNSIGSSSYSKPRLCMAASEGVEGGLGGAKLTEERERRVYAAGMDLLVRGDGCEKEPGNWPTYGAVAETEAEAVASGPKSGRRRAERGPELVWEPDALVLDRSRASGREMAGSRAEADRRDLMPAYMSGLEGELRERAAGSEDRGLEEDQ
jgi:hypothetical protein